MDSDHHETYRVAVARAAALVGGPADLSHRLRVPIEDVKRWLKGDSRPPMGLFLQVVDVLIEEGSKARFLPTPPKYVKKSNGGG